MRRKGFGGDDGETRPGPAWRWVPALLALLLGLTGDAWGEAEPSSPAAAVGAGRTAPPERRGLFRTAEHRMFPSGNFAQWASLIAGIDREAAAGPTPELAAWHRDLETLSGKSLLDRLEIVNRRVNALPYVADADNYGRSDYWATPAQFLSRGGDCEDYALAKFFSLARLGVPPDRMRIVVVRDLSRDIWHAVLVVSTDEGALVLDNVTPEIRSAEQVAHYKALYSVNLRNFWMHG